MYEVRGAAIQPRIAATIESGTHLNSDILTRSQGSGVRLFKVQRDAELALSIDFEKAVYQLEVVE